MSLADTLELSVDGLDPGWHVRALVGAERLHAPFRFEVTTGFTPGERPPPALACDDVVGKKAALTVALVDGSRRSVHGIVRAIRTLYGGYRVTLEPRIALLADTSDHQVFLGDDAVAITQAVLGEHAVDVTSEVVRALAKRDQCVQAFESDLAFVSRILAEEGVFWRVEHEGDKDEVVLVDAPASYPDIPGEATLPFAEDSGLFEGEHVARLSLRHEVATDKFSLRDFDFEKPDLEQTVSESSGGRELERYEFPGGYKEPGLGKTLAKLRLEEAQARRRVLRGETNSTRVQVGHVFAVEGAPRDDMDGRWLVIEADFTAEDARRPHGGAPEGRYHVAFVAVPADQPYRPTRSARAQLGGVQTSTATGPAGADIHTDPHGRMTMLFRWDRRRTADDKSSHWLRSAQPATSGGVALPRTGWETVVAFSGQSGDVPVELGRMYNAAAVPPESLPGNQVSSAIGTLTTPGGGSANILRTNDTAGSESIDLTASKDFTEAAANDKATYVKVDELFSTGANHLLNVGQVWAVKVGGTQSYTVAGKREISVKAERETKATLEMVAIGGARIMTIGDDYKTVTNVMLRVVGGAKIVVPIEQHSRKVTGASIQLVAGTWQQQTTAAGVSVLGSGKEFIGAGKVIRAKGYELKVKKLTQTFGAFREVEATGGDIEDSAKGTLDYAISGAAKIHGANGVGLFAKNSITIKAGGVTITIESSKVTIDGKMDEPKVVVEGDAEYEG